MAALAVQNPPAPAESKSAKKKKAKAERAESPAPASTPADKPSSVVGDAAQDDGESPYIRELQKNIRNVNKKIQNISKTESLVSENKEKSLDELVQLKIINADQRASILNKPRLQTQLNQYEEQLAQYKKVDQEYRTRAAEIKSELEKTLSEQHEKDKSAAVAEIKSAAEAESKKLLHGSLLVLSQFLRLAAARRGDEHSSELDENRALEGVLLQVYSGDEEGVSTMLKLVHGADERTKSVTGDELQTTFAQVKQAAIAHAVPLFPGAEEGAPAVESKAEPVTDPTVANATLTEIDAGTDVALTNGNHAQEAAHTVPSNAEVADEAANASAEASQWDAGNASMSASQEWVEVPRNPTETETGLNATPAGPGNTQSWADDATENAADAPAAPADANDGFQSVPGRNRGRGEGGWRGRGNYRGRGNFRGEGRGRGRGGRGRGGDRGGDGSFRGQHQRRSDDAQ